MGWAGAIQRAMVEGLSSPSKRSLTMPQHHWISLSATVVVLMGLMVAPIAPVWAAPADAAPSADTPIPAADVETIKAIIAEADAADRVLVIDFWATWCVPCVVMFPKIHEGVEALGDKARIVSVSFDGAADEPAARKFLEDQHALKDAFIVTDPQMQSNVVDAFGKAWTDVVVPAILVYDRDGRLAGEFLQGGVADDVIALARQLADNADVNAPSASGPATEQTQ